MKDYAPDCLLSRQQVAEHFGISMRYLEVAVRRGDGPPMCKIGRLARYRFEDVQNWILSKRATIAHGGVPR